VGNKEQVIAKATMLTAVYLGRASMLLFVVFMYVGSLGLVELGFSDAAVLAWDGLLSILFFAQHSVMIRRGVRAKFSRIVLPHYLNAAFSIVSSVLLMAAVVLWQSSATILIELEGFTNWAARGVFFLAMAGTAWGMFAFKSLDPFGDKAIRDHIKGKKPQEQPFQVKGPYVWVRHPLYLFQFLMIWACPDLTADRLLFNVLWSAWIYLGTVLEERDLVADFGGEYRAYQKQVPMLVPWKIPARAGK
jgi:protein-S-isoprenylcysteine O-methyltransferase Ste14